MKTLREIVKEAAVQTNNWLDKNIASTPIAFQQYELSFCKILAEALEPLGYKCKTETMGSGENGKELRLKADKRSYSVFFEPIRSCKETSKFLNAAVCLSRSDPYRFEITDGANVVTCKLLFRKDMDVSADEWKDVCRIYRIPAAKMGQWTDTPLDQVMDLIRNRFAENLQAEIKRAKQAYDELKFIEACMR